MDADLDVHPVYTAQLHTVGLLESTFGVINMFKVNVAKTSGFALGIFLDSATENLPVNNEDFSKFLRHRVRRNESHERQACKFITISLTDSWMFLTNRLLSLDSRRVGSGSYAKTRL